jgi:LCP family protein required for cell wall assembly
MWIPIEEIEPGEATKSATSFAVPAPATPRAKRRTSKRAPLYRRRIVVIPLLMVVFATTLAGVLTYRARATINQVHQLSALPAQITDATQGDDGLPADMTFDTSPAREALETAGITSGGGDDGGLFGGVRDAASDVGDLASGAAVATGVKDPSQDALTILVMGVDARPGAPIDIGVRPDALMVLYLNPTSGVCRGLAIPRDTLAILPGYGETKINHALMLGGIPYQQLVVEQFLDLKIDHYALVDFAGFQDLVNALGGVSIKVPSELKSGETVLFEMGPQMFDGDDALAYARYRGGDDGDVGRVRRQQQIIRGLAQTSAGRDIAAEVGKLLPAVADHVRTDLGATDLVTLANQYRTACSEGSLELDTLQGTLYQPERPDPIYQQPIDYVQIDDAIIEDKVSQLIRS